MYKSFYVGRCPICGQGLLEIVKERKSGTIFVLCDECEGEWKTPKEAIDCINGTRGFFDDVKSVSMEDIISIGWDKYIAEDLS